MTTDRDDVPSPVERLAEDRNWIASTGLSRRHILAGGAFAAGFAAGAVVFAAGVAGFLAGVAGFGAGVAVFCTSAAGASGVLFSSICLCE